jgi:hypothetical protein
MVNEARHMMKLRKPQRNLYVLLGLGAWFLLAAGFFVWSGVQAHGYRDQTKTYTTQTKQILTDANGDLKRAHDEANPAVTRETLLQLATNLEAKRKQLPTAPGVFGFRVGADDAYNRLSRLDAAIAIYAADLRAAVVYIEYQQKTALDLQLLTLKSAGNAQQITELANAWSDVITTVTDRVPLIQLKEVSATLLQKLGEAKTIVTQLGDFYKANDEAGFKAKYDELRATIAALKPIGDQIVVVGAQIDAQLAKDMANIAKNL